MGKRSRRIRRSVDSEAVNYSLSETQRTKIEKLTNYGLSEVTWGLVEIATRRFIADAKAEQGLKKEDFRRLLKNVTLAVVEMQLKLDSPISEPLAAGLHDGTRQLYERYFANAHLNFHKDDSPFSLLSMAADAMLAVATHTDKHLPQEFSLAPPIGEAWNTWIVFICSFLAQAGHSCAVRKDGGDTGRASPIVVFVDELQKTLPGNLEKCAGSQIGLAQAINRAKRDSPKSLFAPKKKK